MKPLVIYHADCADGFGAAFAAWLKLGDEAEYLPMQYGQDPTESIPAIKDREVYILDFSFERVVMDGLFANAKRVVWLDHHKTAFEMYGWSTAAPLCGADLNISANHVIDLDNSRSGAWLAWEYFHSPMSDAEIPMLIQHIDDRDRWQFKLEGSKELHAALQSYKPWSFEQWELYLLGSTVQGVMAEGSAILRAQDASVASIAKHARKFAIIKPIDGIGFTHYGLACNSPIHQSELGHVLATQSDTFGLVWHLGADNRVKCSLRSNGDYDVSAIAKALGGGGHRNAAGFETDINTLLGWLK